jgi:hypothetical protein
MDKVRRPVERFIWTDKNFHPDHQNMDGCQYQRSTISNR